MSSAEIRVADPVNGMKMKTQYESKQEVKSHILEEARHRVLVWGMSNHLAGTESVVTNITRSIDESIAFDFLVFESLTSHNGLLSGVNREFILPSKRTQFPRYKRAIKGFFREHYGEYDAVWVNLNTPNNVDVLALAEQFDIPKRIVHSHNSRRTGLPHTRLLSILHAGDPLKLSTDRWACSKKAGRFMFGDADFVFVPNAIDFERFAFSQKRRESIRLTLDVGDDCLVLGNVGRLARQKNQTFLLEVFVEVKRRHPNSICVIVGSGELRTILERKAMKLGVSQSVKFVGSQSDIQSWLSSFDVFVFPSLFEGLSVSLLEAQANGLPCVVSGAVSDEAFVSKAICQVQKPDVVDWANAILRTSRNEQCLTADAKIFDLVYQRSFYRNLFGLENE